MVREKNSKSGFCSHFDWARDRKLQFPLLLLPSRSPSVPLLLRRGVCDRRKMARNGSLQRCRAGERRAERTKRRNGGGAEAASENGEREGRRAQETAPGQKGNKRVSLNI